MSCGIMEPKEEGCPVDYLAPLTRTAEYIEKHLNEKITLKDLVKVSGYSVYHLIRIFDAAIGETIGSYIRKRRLAVTAEALLNTEKRVLDIALESGFGSSEAFSRSFKSVYGLSPYAYRKRGEARYVGFERRLDRIQLCHRACGITLQPRFVTLGEIHLAGIRGRTTAPDTVLPRLWDRWDCLRAGVPCLEDGRSFGVCETPAEAACLEADGSVPYIEFVGAETNPFLELPEGVLAKTLPGGRYAVFTHTGPAATLPQTYDYIWGSWTLTTDEVLDDREDFEVYDSRFLGPECPDSQINIYIPVRSCEMRK